jgi:hypothetical protein
MDCSPMVYGIGVQTGDRMGETILPHHLDCRRRADPGCQVP